MSEDAAAAVVAATAAVAAAAVAAAVAAAAVAAVVDICKHTIIKLVCAIRPSQTAAFLIFAANRKEVLILSSQEDLVPN